MNANCPSEAAAAPTLQTIRVLVVPDDDREPVRLADVGQKVSEVSSLLGIWFPEPISGPDWVAWCDEYGMLRQLPVNFRATRWLESFGRPSAGPVLGPVMFCGPELDDGLSDVPDDIVRLAIPRGAKRKGSRA
jgi:hypothetical protein